MFTLFPVYRKKSSTEALRNPQIQVYLHADTKQLWQEGNSKLLSKQTNQPVPSREPASFCGHEVERYAKKSQLTGTR